MSRAFEMEITISNITEPETKQVRELFKDLWDISGEDCGNQPNSDLLFLTLTGVDYLNGGRDEKDFFTDVQVAVWKALDRYVPIHLKAVDLDNVPMEYFDSVKEDYATLIETTKGEA